MNPSGLNVANALERAGFVRVNQRGSHLKLRKVMQGKVLTVMRAGIAQAAAATRVAACSRHHCGVRSSGRQTSCRRYANAIMER